MKMGLGLVPLLLLSPTAWAQTVEFYHLDAIGNVLAVTSYNGAVVEQHDYLPYGEELCGTQACGSVNPGQPKRFTGKERDVETGWTSSVPGTTDPRLGALPPWTLHTRSKR